MKNKSKFDLTDFYLPERSVSVGYRLRPCRLNIVLVRERERVFRDRRFGMNKNFFSWINTENWTTPQPFALAFRPIGLWILEWWSKYRTADVCLCADVAAVAMEEYDNISEPRVFSPKYRCCQSVNMVIDQAAVTV